MCVRVTLAPALIKVNREKNLFLCLALARKANNNLFIAKAYFLYQLNVSENSGEAVFLLFAEVFSLSVPRFTCLKINFNHDWAIT